MEANAERSTPVPSDSPTIPSTCSAIEGCTIPVDVVLQSSDGKLLGAHSKNLASFAAGFPLPGTTTRSKIIPLSDKGNILLLFLKFTHNEPAPDMSGLGIDDLLDLAEVADKYCNYFALTACRHPMRLLAEVSSKNALKVLRSKAIRRDFEGMDPIAVKTLDLPITDVIKCFGPRHAQESAIWVLYQQGWVDFTNRYITKVRSKPVGTIMHRVVHRSSESVSRGQTVQCDAIDTKIIAPLRAAVETSTPSLERFNMQVEAICKAYPSNANPCEGHPSSLCNSAYDNWCKAVRQVLEKPPLWCQFLSY